MDVPGFLKELEETGEEQVRIKIAAKLYNPRRYALAEDWLKTKSDKRTNNKSTVSVVATVIIAICAAIGIYFKFLNPSIN